MTSPFVLPNPPSRGKWPTFGQLMEIYPDEETRQKFQGSDVVRAGLCKDGVTIHEMSMGTFKLTRGEDGVRIEEVKNMLA